MHGVIVITGGIPSRKRGEEVNLLVQQYLQQQNIVAVNCHRNYLQRLFKRDTTFWRSGFSVCVSGRACSVRARQSLRKNAGSGHWCGLQPYVGPVLWAKMLIRSQDNREVKVQELFEKIGTPAFGRILRRERKALHLTQVELAQMAKVRQATISKLENNPTSCEFDTHYRICTALQEHFAPKALRPAD